MLNVRFAARDPGGANVLAAFLERSHASCAFVPDVWSLSRAHDVFVRTGAAARRFPDDVTPEQLASAWAQAPADALVTGTSHYPAFESSLWTIARAHRCPSIAVIDQWCNLDLRFREGRPDYVGAIDADQRRELIAMGFHPDAVVTVGHPWLWDLRARPDGARAAATPADEGAVRVLFVSENIAGDVAGGRNTPFGFDELDAFDVVYRAAGDAAARGARASIVVRLHPYEDAARFEAHLKRLAPPPGVGLRIAPRGDDARAWVRWADLVLGISSMLLYEAMVLERPVASVQPGLSRENTFAAAVNGYADAFIDAAAATPALVGLICDAEARARALARHRMFASGLSADGLSPLLDWIHAHAHTHP